MENLVEGMLYVDPQAARTVGFCEICGGALYGQALGCTRCERRKP